MIACFLSNISAKYYKNPSMLSRVIGKNVGDVFFETQCSLYMKVSGSRSRSHEQKGWKSLFPQCKTSIGNSVL